MALLERVSTLIRANLNDLIDRAEHPEKMIKQVILDMENQLMQVKTQVAIAIADEHLLKAKHTENSGKETELLRKAELALDKSQEPLARAALERSLTHKQMAAGFSQQIADQAIQVENLKTALRKLEEKLLEARAKSDLLIAEHRRARAVNRAAEAQQIAATAHFDRMAGKVQRQTALGAAKTQLLVEDPESRLESLDKDDRVDRLLADLKSKRSKT